MKVPLGIGPYEACGLDSPSVVDARMYFLHFAGGFKDTAVEKPEHLDNRVSASLCDDVLPHLAALVCRRFARSLFSETRIESFASDAELYKQLRLNVPPEQVEQYISSHRALESESPGVHQRLLAWASRWNLQGSDWCLDFAVSVMRFWIFDEWGRRYKTWYAHPSLRRDAGRVWDTLLEHLEFEKKYDAKFCFRYEDLAHGDRTFSYSAWDFLFERSDEWVRRVRDEFSKHLKSGGKTNRRELKRHLSAAVKAYVESLRREMGARGYRPTPRKSTLLHFVWLVRYQVQGWDFPMIAQKYHAERQTVDEAVRNTALLVGLKLRDGSKGGRPKKTSRISRPSNKRA